MTPEVSWYSPTATHAPAVEQLTLFRVATALAPVDAPAGSVTTAAVATAPSESVMTIGRSPPDASSSPTDTQEPEDQHAVLFKVGSTAPP
jgi:hypothetical protein